MGISTADVRIIFQGTVGTLQQWLDGRSFTHSGLGGSLLTEPTFAAAIEFVTSANAVIHAYSAATSKVAPELELTVDAALHLDLPAIFVSGWIQSAASVERDVAVGLAARMRDIVSVYSIGSGGRLGYEPVPLRPRREGKPVRLPEIAVVYVGAAALDQWSGEHADKDYQLKLERIKSGFGLRISELAKLLGVTREAIRQWNSGAGISEDRWGQIDRLNGIVTQLQRYFRPETVPGQVRRKIPALNGMTALQLIEAGRDAELLGRYKRFFEGEITQ
jgi:hypothetical protein